jgi:tetratricopeptide (TPR) repeat protein
VPVEPAHKADDSGTPAIREVAPESVRAQVARIAASRTFQNAPVLRHFLDHITDYAVSGKTDQLKEYALGVDVFARGTSFDPRVDTIVRVQARRLRAKLEEYYRVEGQADAVILELPKGHYVPGFRLAVTEPEGAYVFQVAEPRAVDEGVGELNGQAHANDLSSAVRADSLSPLNGADKATRPFRVAVPGLLLGALAMALVGFVAFWQRDLRGRAIAGAEAQSPPAEARGPASNTVAVASFENRTGDSSLDRIGRLAAERVIRTVAESTSVEVVPQPVEMAVGTAGRSASPREVSSASLLVTGAYYLHQGDLEFQVRILDAASGRLLHGVEPITGPQSRPADAFERIEQKIAGAVAIHVDEFFGGLLVVSPPPTLEGYREYRAGLEIFQSDYTRSLAHLERALQADPAFLLPLVVMAFAHGNVGQVEQVEAVLARMERHVDRATPAERLLIEFMRAHVEGRRPQALRVLIDLERAVPASLLVNHNIVQESVALNRPRLAVETFDKLPSSERTLRHSIGSYRIHFLAMALHMMGEYDRELAEVTRAQRYAPGVLRFLEAEVRPLAARGRVADLTRVIDRSLATGPTAGAIGTPGVVMQSAARELRAHGYREESLKVAARAVEWYDNRPKDGSAGRAHRQELGRALYLAERWKDADRVFSGLVAEHPDEVMYSGYLGLIAARTGNVPRARAISKKIERARPPEGVRERFVLALSAVGRARIAALLGDRQQALSLLREALTAGFPVGLNLHGEPDLEALLDYEPYLELVRPAK